MQHEGATDPGWGKVFRPDDGLSVLRTLFLSLLLASYLILVVLSFLEAPWGTPGGLPLVGAIGLGTLSIGNALLVRNLFPLKGDDPTAVAALHRTRFFVGFALAEAPLLIAFVMTFIVEEKWPYAVVLPAFTVAMILIAPTRSGLEAEQRRLNHSGRNVNLLAALMSSLPPEDDRIDRST